MIIFLWIFVCNVIFPSLSLSNPSCGNFPISSASDGKARAKLLFGSHELSQRPWPQPQLGFLVWIWGSNTCLSYSPCIWSQKSEASTFSTPWPKHWVWLCILLLPSKHLLISLLSQIFMGGSSLNFHWACDLNELWNFLSKSIKLYCNTISV